MLIIGHVVALIGSILVISAFAGLGRAVQRSFGEGGTVAEAIGLGFAINLTIGGLLNLFGAISLATVIAIEIGGLVAFFLDRRQLIYEIKSYVKQPYPLLLVSVFYLLSVSTGAFNWNDDFNGYLIPVEKIIQTHQLGSDPFLLERLEGLSHFYAQAFYVLQFGYEHLSMFDPGLGRIIIGLLLIERLAKYFATYPVIALALLTSALLVAWTWNTAAPVAILTALLTLVTFEVIEQKTRPVYFGLVSAAAISLKVSAVPYVGLLGAIWVLSVARRHGIRYTTGATVRAAFAGVATLLPWMIALDFSSGTFMFPILGDGYYTLGAIYRFFSWDALWHTARTQTHFIFGNLLVILAGLVLVLKCEQQTRWLIAAIAAATFSCILLIIYATGGGGESFRYTLPICASFGIVALVKIANGNVVKSYRAKILFSLLALTAAFFIIPARAFLTINRDNVFTIISGQAQNKLEALLSLRIELRQAQELVPEHERILALTDAAMLLDFVRNPVWPTGNYPGASSPPPKISTLKTPSELRGYLLRLGIAYVLFEPHMEVISADAVKLATPAETYLAHPWDYNVMIASMITYQNIARLAESSSGAQSLNGYEVVKLSSP